MFLALLTLSPAMACAAGDPDPDYRPAVPDAQYLEQQGAVIGEIIIDNANIFDPSIPGEDYPLYRLANQLHVRTRPTVIEQQLLFKSGDRFQERLLQESERILRRNKYLHDAFVEPVRYADGKVDILVRTIDVWTLDPRFSFGRAGGKNKLTIGLKDENVLGMGIYLGLHQRYGVDRDSTEISFADRHLGNSWFALSGSYADNSDGSRAQFAFGKPFYSLDARRSLGLSLLSENRIDSLYDRGEIQSRFSHEIDAYQIHAGVSSGLRNGWTRRYTVGLGYDEHRFGPGDDPSLPHTEIPEDRKFVYPFLEWELLQDHFEEAQNHDQIGQTEDRHLGTRVDLRLGFASEAFGSLNDALLLDFATSTGFGKSQEKSLLTTAEYHARLERDGVRDGLLTMGAVYHQRQGEQGLFHVALTGNVGSNLDLDHQLLLGGDNGLRGYPLRYQGGDASVLMTVEERLFTNWYPFHLIRVGAAVFFDAGRTWGTNPVGGENLGLLKDVGFGLRLGNSRSGVGRLVHLDFAFPLDGDSSIDSMQILFKAKSSF